MLKVWLLTWQNLVQVLTNCRSLSGVSSPSRPHALSLAMLAIELAGHVLSHVSS